MHKFLPKTALDKFPALAFSLLFLVTTGCGPLISFGDDGPADDVYSLRYISDPVATQDLGPIIHLEEPLMTNGLASGDIAVALEDGRRTMLKGVRWSANASDLVRDYLIGAVSDGAGVLLIGEGGLDIKASCRLGLKVREFAFAPGSTTRSDRVNISIEFTLVRYADAHLIGQPVFEVSYPVENSNGRSIVTAFHEGMDTVSDKAATWLAPLSSQCAAKADG